MLMKREIQTMSQVYDILLLSLYNIFMKSNSFFV